MATKSNSLLNNANESGRVFGRHKIVGRSCQQPNPIHISRSKLVGDPAMGVNPLPRRPGNYSNRLLARCYRTWQLSLPG